MCDLRKPAISRQDRARLQPHPAKDHRQRSGGPTESAPCEPPPDGRGGLMEDLPHHHAEEYSLRLVILARPTLGQVPRREDPFVKRPASVRSCAY